MKLIVCFSLLLSLSFSLLVSASDSKVSDPVAEREISYAFLSQAVASQPRNQGDYLKFAASLGIDLKTKQGRELRELALRVKQWPEIKRTGNMLTIVDGQFVHTIELVDRAAGMVKINNVLVQLNPNASFVTQFKNAVADSFHKNRKQSWLRYLLPTAEATETSTKVAGYTVGGAVVGGTAAMGMAVLGNAAMGGVAIGTTPVATGIAVLGGGGAALACLGIQGWMGGAGFWSRYANCMAAPLTLMGMNPRDRMYLKSFDSCSPSKIAVTLRSSSGRFEKRVFEYKDDKLINIGIANGTNDENSTKVSFSADDEGISLVKGASTKNGKVSAALTKQQLIDAQPLLRDADFYRGICKDDSRRKEVISRLNESGWGERTKYDISTPDELHDDAINAQ